MKKTYLIAAFLGASFFAYNQALQKPPSNETIQKLGKLTPTHQGNVKALGTSLWSSDFSNTSEWTIGGNGAQGTWVMGSTSTLPSSPLYYSAIQSTTVANGIAYFAGIQYLLAGNVTSQNAWIQMTNSIDCSAHSVVSLEFEQAYRAFNTDRTYVEVSLDGGATWVQTTDINPNVAANSSTTETVAIRNFNVNNSPTVKFRFRWENTSTSPSGSGYAWQIDDVSIKTLSDHDIAIDKYLYGTTTNNKTLYYHQIPLSQTAPIEASAVLKNRGSQNQTNVVFTATESVNGVYTGNSTPVGILSNGGDSVVVAPNFTPSAFGNYKMDYSISYNNIDDYPLNNTVDSYKFSVGQSIYARDSSTQTSTTIVYGQISPANMTPLNGMEAGNSFTMAQTANLTAIDFQFGNTINPGTLVFGKLYDANFNAVPNGETAPYIMAIGDEGEHKTLSFDNPVGLFSGTTYIVVVKSTSSNFSLATAGKSAPQTSFVYYLSDATWYYTTSTPVVRMNFAPSTIVSTNTIVGFAQLLGAPSPADSVNIGGINLASDITITAPANFEISTTLAGPYSSTLSLTNTNGTIASTKIYVRLNGTVINLTQAGDIAVTATGAATRLIALQGQTYDFQNITIGAATAIDSNGVGTRIGEYVSLTGVLHCDNFRTNGYDITMIDANNDGINIFNSTYLNGYIPAEGDEIKVEGQIEQFNGLLQIKPSSITVLSQGVALQTATVVTALDETTESQFIELQGLNLINNETNWPNNGNIDVTDGTTTFRVRVPAASAMAGTPIPTGAFYITGIGKQFDSSSPYTSGYQIFPCDAGLFCDIDISVTVDDYSLTANASGLNYQWINCTDTSELVGETNQSFNAPGEGYYAVVITDGACVDTSDCIFLLGANVNENDLAGVSIYPNPMNDVLKIIDENGLLESVELVTAAGRIVYNSKVVSNEFEINVSQISSGVYFVNVRSANSVKTFKVIK